MIYKSYLAEQSKSFLTENKLVLFYGENLGLKNDFKRRIFHSLKDKIIRKHQEEILKNKDNFFEEVLNFSLFGENKIFLIDDVNDKFIDILHKIENKIDQNKIFLFSNILDKKSKLRNYFEKSKEMNVVACYQDNIITIKKIVRNELNSYNNLNNENINIIAENCNLDRDKLYNEIEKIKIYFSNLKIDTEKLKILLDLKVNEDFNLVRDEAINGNKVQINRLLSDTVLDNDKNIMYINTFNQRFYKLAEILQNKNNSRIESIVENIKPPIFWKDKPTIINQLKKWNSKKINTVLKKSYDIELRLKSNSTINHNLLIKMLILDICQLANAS
jgi:DNA polymerase III subunit delta